MRTAVRAHRILNALENYQKIGTADDWPSKLCAAHLGEPIGCYRNPKPKGEVVWIFVDGLAWSQDGCVVNVKFEDIVNVKLPSGKKSKGLVLKLGKGREFLLPVTGQCGRFFDSMEMLRFLRRVMEDLRRQERVSAT